MAPEIRFNSFGIPYLVEFANVTFRTRSRAGSAASSTNLTADTLSVRSNVKKPWLERRPSRPLRRSPSVATFESDWTFATASSDTIHARHMQKQNSSTTLRPSVTVSSPALSPAVSLMNKPLPEITVESEIETGGEGLLIRFASQLTQPHRKLSQRRLARLKYRIAQAVKAAGMDSSPAAGDKANPSDTRGSDYRASFSSIRSEEVETRGMPNSLFRGTYGQVMKALDAAGLTTTPCNESGEQHATRLGALFVARQDEFGGVEFTKLTLWA